MNPYLPNPGYSVGVTHQAKSLKRNRSDTKYFPPLPRISNELALQTFTHVSLRRYGAKPEEHDDNERLAMLGKAVLDVAVTRALFRKQPLLAAPLLVFYQQAITSSEDVLDGWVKHYQLRKKIRCTPDVHSKLADPKETETIFCAYVGSVFMTSGVSAVNDWIEGLVSQEDLSVFLGQEPEADRMSTVKVPPPKRAKSETLSPTMQQPMIFFASQPPPPLPPTRDPPPHLVHSNRQPIYTRNPLAPAQPELPFLPLFNEQAAKRGVKVEYKAEAGGVAHAQTWTIRCEVNGICKGIGNGKTKQGAKDEAARQAYFSMGWT